MVEAVFCAELHTKSKIQNNQYTIVGKVYGYIQDILIETKVFTFRHIL